MSTLRPGPPLPDNLPDAIAEIKDLRIRLARQIDVRRVMEPETAEQIERLKKEVADLWPEGK